MIRITQGDYLLAIDPGVTTGIVIARYTDPQTSFDIHDTLEIAYDDRSALATLLLNIDPRWIVIEDFKLFAKYADAQINSRFEVVKTIERVHVYCEDLNIVDRIVMQEPLVRHSTARVLDHHKPYMRGRHVLAAYQHLRYFVALFHNALAD
jgi:hypothetical protein